MRGLIEQQRATFDADVGGNDSPLLQMKGIARHQFFRRNGYPMAIPMHSRRNPQLLPQ